MSAYTFTYTFRIEGSQYSFEGDFSVTMKHKFNKYWAWKLLKLHQDEQMLFFTYKNTAFTSKPTYTELDQYKPLRPCDAEEADQKIVRNTSNLLRNGYKNILIRTVNTDVLNLHISYFSHFKFNDVSVYAHDKLFISMSYHGVILCSVCMGRANLKCLISG